MTEVLRKPYWDDEAKADRLWVDTMFPSYEIQGTHAGLRLCWATTEVESPVHIYINGQYAPGVETKGQIRKLCNVLGVPIYWELDESQNTQKD